MMKLWEGDVMLVLLHLLDMFYCCPNIFNGTWWCFGDEQTTRHLGL